MSQGCFVLDIDQRDLSITIECATCGDEADLGYGDEVYLSACNDWAENHECEETK